MFRKLNNLGVLSPVATLACIAAISGFGGSASAADLGGSLKDQPEPPVVSWRGFYLGTQSGAFVGTTHFGDPMGTSIYGDNVGASGDAEGVELGYNFQSGHWVYGVAFDANWVDSDASNTCLAYSPNYVSANCRAQVNAYGTLAGRVGWTLGPDSRTLLYGKAGAAWLNNKVSIENGSQFDAIQPELTNSTTQTKWGWTLGAGVEREVAPLWTIKAEYAYMDFGGDNATYPRSLTYPPMALAPGGSTSVSDQAHVFKVGVNRRLGADGSLAPQLGAISLKDFISPPANGLEVDFGARYWYSTGGFQWNHLLNNHYIQSRLTYSGLTGSSGEIFARVDLPMNIFIKGNVGLGGTTGGKMNDEDWGMLDNNMNPDASYQNTLSKDNGNLSYANADVGYSLLRGPGYKAGPFIGYFHYSEKMDSYGCVDYTGGFCLSPSDSRLMGSEDTTWDALRIGSSAEFALGRGFKFTGDAAYLAAATFSGRDNHLLRHNTTFDDQNSSGGAGVQFEGVLSYDVTDHLSVGVGGRYWAMWAKGSSNPTEYNNAGALLPSEPSPEKTSMERYGVLLQASYKFGAETPVPLK
jgi:opacity protein-like surface antigen